MPEPVGVARVYLIGPRGSGKSTLATALATALQWSWVDADRLLEQRAGRTIRAIFDTDGEPTFRDLESALLRELATLDRHVIATGGGVILRPENRELLHATGLVVRLTADVATLCQRLRGDTATAEQRPSLTGRAAVDPDEIAAVLAARESLYTATAHATVDTTGLTAEAIVAAILSVIPE
jgi:shikimate kinase